MKLSIISLLLICIISCKEQGDIQAPSTGITILNDITDKRQVKPDASFALTSYQLDKNKNGMAYFRIISTTDMLLNPSREALLPTEAITEEENTHDDPYHREKRVLAFYEQVRQAVKENTLINADTIKYNHSECFRSICREITELKKKQYTNSILIVYSDLRELSDIETTYAEAGIDTAKIKKAFIKANLLPKNLNGLTVYFIFQPKDRDEDIKFMLMHALYQQLLEERGAIVLLQSDNNQIKVYE